MAVLDNILRIGEHSVAVGPVCELSAPSASGSSGRSSSSSSGSSGAAAVMTAALALLAAVPAVVSQRLLDAAVGAAADVAAGQASRQSVLHAADTLLALATVQQELQLQQQQKLLQAAGSCVLPSTAAAATAASGHNLEQAAAVLHCALGDPHSCVTAEELAASGHEGASGGSSSSSTPRWQLLVTPMGLHVTLCKDLGRLWWAYHTRLALSLGGRA
jgi:hypothetical protein